MQHLDIYPHCNAHFASPKICLSRHKFQIRIWDGEKVGDVLVSGKHNLVKRKKLKERDTIQVKRLHRSRSSDGKMVILLLDIAIMDKHKYNLGLFAVDQDSGESDEEGSTTKKGKQSFGWRTDPVESFSDWTIVINGEDIYHVHKCIMGSGRRSSRYFERMFRMERPLQENTLSRSEIKLEHESAAEAFPIMLDYMYSKSDNVKATTENAVALRFLAGYFRIESLWHNVNNLFIQKDLNVRTAPTYLMEGALYHDDHIVGVASEFCTRHFFDLDVKSLSPLSPDIFKEIVAQLEPDDDSSESDLCTTSDDEQQRCLSEIVAAYCREQENALDADFIREVTDPERMPNIEPEAALTIMRHAYEAGCFKEDLLENEEESLKWRCVESISHGWAKSIVPKLISDKNKKEASDYDRLPLDLKNKILERVVLVVHEKLQMGEDLSM